MSSRSLLLPARVQARDVDDTGGKFPVHLRTGDDDRHGRYNLFPFNDLTTMIFTASLIDLPTGLPINSTLLSGTSHFQVTGSIRKGVADSYSAVVENEDTLRPFDESRLIEQGRTDVFFQTGSSLANVGFGLTSPLASKTILTIDVDPIASTEAVFSHTGGASLYPMLYYNFIDRKWEPIGLGTAKNDVAQRVIETVPIGISPSTNQPFVTNELTIPLRGLPVSTFGFPAHAKFHATSSQCLQLSGVINHPFVVEKLVYEFSGSFDAAYGTVSGFAILNQRTPGILDQSILVTNASTGSDLILTMSLPTQIQLTANGSSTRVNNIRDIVTFATVGIQRSTVALNVDLLVPNESDTSAFQVTSSFVLSASIKSPSINSPGVLKKDTADIFVLENSLGSRNGVGRATGRDLIAGVTGLVKTGSVVLTDGDAPEIRPNKTPYKVNPYVLMPSDEIVLAWHVGFDYSTGRTALSISPGKGRLRLYGSLLRNGIEFHDTRNQQLTTDTTHELIGDEFVLDQFLTEHRTFYSGTMLGEYVTGAMTTDLSSRKVLASTVNADYVSQSFAVPCVDNEITSRGKLRGFSRGVAGVSINERFYDSMMPPIDKIVTINGAASTIFYHPTFKYVDVQFGDNGTYAADVSWDRAFPFEAKYSTLQRQTDAAATLEATKDNSGNSIDSKRGPGVYGRVDASNIGQNLVLFADNQTGVRIPPTSREFLLHAFGIGDFVSGSTRPANSYHVENAMCGAIVRGFKYGVYNAIAEFSKSVFRCDHHGFLRDTLEQRVDTKFYDTVGIKPDGSSGRPGTLSSPIQVKFVEPRTSILTSPRKTISSNLSMEATSSVPYFDGLVRNREEPIETSILNTRIESF